MSIDDHAKTATEKPMQQKARLFGQNAVSQLTSYEQRELLDAVDKLRRADISGEDFSIPQIIVCGDQSSGKSSVLEAISQLKFPVGTGTTTRFATEVVLRNNSLTSGTPVTLKIIADRSRTPEEKARIETFTFVIQLDEPEAFSDAVNAALKHLESIEPGKKFWYDRLHVEISGPKQPNLTLVDLPGLIHTEASANRGDTERIKNLVKRYISEPKAVILAVVRADVDIDNQEIIQLVKNSSDAVARTMGILTSTDRLTAGSDQEKAAILLASNNKIFLGAGWHVLRNMSHQGKQAVSYEHRDEVEQDFFSRLPWTKLDPKSAGIAALREKLSLSLFDSITRDLSRFVGQMERKLGEYRSRRDKLGAARDSPDSQTHHLQRIQKELQDLIQDALEGRQGRSEFFDGSSNRALRTIINRCSHKFATRMREQGKQYIVFSTSSERNEQLEDYSPDLNKPNFYPPYKPDTVEMMSSNIPLKDYCQFLATFDEETRGTNLQGFQTSDTQTAIFRQQSAFWDVISKQYVDACYHATFEFMKCAVMHVAGRYTGEKLIRAFMNSSFTQIGSTLEAKLDELLWPYRKSHPSTQNPKYSSGVRPNQKAQASHNDQESSDGANACHDDESWTETAQRLKYMDELISAANAIVIADVYYDLALDTFVDNVTILGVEAILLNKVKGLLSYEDVAQLRGERLAEIAGEPPGAQQERAKLEIQISVLREVIRTCKTYKQSASTYLDGTPQLNEANEEHERSAHNKSARADAAQSTTSKSVLFANATPSGRSSRSPQHDRFSEPGSTPGSGNPSAPTTSGNKGKGPLNSNAKATTQTGSSSSLFGAGTVSGPEVDHFKSNYTGLFGGDSSFASETLMQNGPSGSVFGFRPVSDLTVKDSGSRSGALFGGSTTSAFGGQTTSNGFGANAVQGGGLFGSFKSPTTTAPITSEKSPKAARKL